MLDTHCPDMRFLGRPRQLNWSHEDCIRRIEQQDDMPEDIRQEAGACADCPTGSWIYFQVKLGG